MLLIFRALLSAVEFDRKDTVPSAKWRGIFVEVEIARAEDSSKRFVRTKSRKVSHQGTPRTNCFDRYRNEHSIVAQSFERR